MDLLAVALTYWTPEDFSPFGPQGIEDILSGGMEDSTSEVRESARKAFLNGYAIKFADRKEA